MKCIAVTPEKTVFDRETQFIALPLYDGEYGIAPGHTPVVGRLGAGELRLTSGDGVERWYVEGGFMEAKNDVITILTGRIVPVADLKLSDAEAALASARGKVATRAQDVADRARQMETARNQIRLIKRHQK
ncbi:MAG: ATP synthase F1 subunit epsilon [Planctomycetia bacterium]|nr:ATP synthase F1 subunit epsilon [Planctomycetia bacterium]